MDQSLYRAEIMLEDGEEEELERRLPEYMLQHLATHKRDWLEVYQSLLRERRHHHAAWFMSSAYKGTGSWLLWRGGTDGRFPRRSLWRRCGSAFWLIQCATHATGPSARCATPLTWKRPRSSPGLQCPPSCPSLAP